MEKYMKYAVFAAGVGVTAVICGAAYRYYRRKREYKNKQEKMRHASIPICNEDLRYVAGETNEKIREIEALTGTKIEIIRKYETQNPFIVIYGFMPDVHRAKMIIKDEMYERKLAREAAFEKEHKERSNWALNNWNDEPVEKNREAECSWNEDAEEQNDEKTIYDTIAPEKSDPSDINVYVSAACNPSKFYVQLEDDWDEFQVLTRQITHVYRDPELRKKYELTKPAIGDHVAVRHSDYNFYRARIVEIEPNKDMDKTVYDLVFYDFGDNCYAYLHSFFALDKKFTQIEPYAKECFLANIRPVNPENPKCWTKEAIDRFDELVHLATEYRLKARTKVYKSIRRKARIPGFALYDDQYDGKYRDIGKILIAEGHAVEKDEFDLNVSIDGESDTASSASFN